MHRQSSEMIPPILIKGVNSKEGTKVGFKEVFTAYVLFLFFIMTIYLHAIFKFAKMFK